MADSKPKKTKAKTPGETATGAGNADTEGNKGNEAYRVLARKYRPQNFSDLIGQDAMVQTLTNAFKTGRIAQAYMLTGVRGVGKTTTARLIARALNYTLTDGPSIEMDGFGEHCEAILEARHIDIIEMDAASNTGIDDVREIIEAVRYKPVSARYKVYIIDEVHMLSRQAFNGLLKTLEEPPAHIKFIFATTEIRKVPVTVLSRCQRFDLRRVEADQLIAHFRSIADAEGARIDDRALALIARAAEGSVRDGLSLLDQAIASDADISDDDIRAMLGLADRAQVIDLFAALMAGEAKRALELFDALYEAGGDPATALSDLAEFTHLVTRFKVTGTAAHDPALSETERKRGGEFADKLDMRVLARAWQMLLKGLDEIGAAGDLKAAAEMVLIRLAYVADLPSPDELIKRIGGEAASSVPAAQAKNAAPGDAASSAPSREAVQKNTMPENVRPENVRPENAPEIVTTAAAPARGDTLAVAAQADATAQPQDAPLSGDKGRDPPQSFEQVIALIGSKRDIKLKTELERGAHLVSFKPGHIELRRNDNAPPRIANELGRKLTDWTGMRWVVVLSNEAGAETLAEQAERSRALQLDAAREEPLVLAALDTFPDAEIVEVRDMFARGAAADTGDIPDDPDNDPDEQAGDGPAGSD